MLKIAIIIFSSIFTFSGDCVKMNRVVGRYHYFVLAQIWPMTAHWKYERKWTTADCNLSPAACSSLIRNKWVVHGLWPEKNFGKNPRNCTENLPAYKKEMINSDVRLKLNYTWLSYTHNCTDELYWKNEWEVHGSCARDLPSLKFVNEYFSKTLELLNLYRMDKILANAGIIPRAQPYELKSIIKSVRDKLNVQPMINCAMREHNAEKEQFLFEIYICLNKTFALQDCVRPRNRKCDEQKKIIFYPKWSEENDTKPYK